MVRIKTPEQLKTYVKKSSVSTLEKELKVSKYSQKYKQMVRRELKKRRGIIPKKTNKNYHGFRFR